MNSVTFIFKTYRIECQSVLLVGPFGQLLTPIFAIRNTFLLSLKWWLRCYNATVENSLSFKLLTFFDIFITRNIFLYYVIRCTVGLPITIYCIKTKDWPVSCFAVTSCLFCRLFVLDFVLCFNLSDCWKICFSCLRRYSDVNESISSLLSINFKFCIILMLQK